MIDPDRWPRKARQRSRTKGANGSEQIQSVSSFHIKEDEAGFASKHKYDKFEKKNLTCPFDSPDIVLEI